MFSFQSFLLCLLNLAFLVQGYSTYPRRYSRDGVWGICPDHCQCMTLNQRGTRGLLDTWGEEAVSDKSLTYFSRGVNDAAARNGRSMICQGLRQLPTPIPSDISKLTAYGDSSRSSAVPTDKTSNGKQQPETVVTTQIQQISRNSFRGNRRLKEITMSGNNIGVMYPYVFFHLRELISLHLPNNNIRHLSAAVFYGLYSLRELELSDNMIRYLPTPIFRYLRELTSMKLNGNKIRSIQRNLFRSLTKLQILDLSRNNITDFYDDAFDYNTQLRELHLSGNRLWKLRPRWFRNLYNLKSLSLRGNAIKEIKPESFVNLFNLNELLFSANRIHKIHDGAFRNLRDLHILDISTNDIAEIPTTCFIDLDYLESLYFGNNKLTTIKNGTFVFAKKLKELDLSRNSIENIDRESLHTLKQLQSIDLSHNKLRKIQRQIIHGMEELKEINLEHNFIGRIEDDAFKTSPADKMSKLSILNLKSNDLRIVGAETLQGMPNLKSLDIGQNNIKRIHNNAFQNLGKVQTLGLYDNKLRQINKGLLSSLPDLRELDLSNNKLQVIDDSTFAGLKQLEELDIDTNQIHTISDKAFLDMGYLVSLDLNGNKMLNFNFSVLRHLPRLTMIDLSENNLFTVEIPVAIELRISELVLSNNNLHTVSSNIRNILATSSMVALNGNPLSCDCHMSWLVDPVISRQIRVERNGEIICKAPNRLHGRKAMDLSPDEFVCEAVNTSSTAHTSLTCEDKNFLKKKWYSPKTASKAMISNHATIFDGSGKPLANGVLISENWILAVGNALNRLSQSTASDNYRVKIGRVKGSKRIRRVIRHPLSSFGMQQYNVALIRLESNSNGKENHAPCFMTEKQFKIISKVLKRITMTTRVTGRSLFSKLKPRKGKILSKCIHDDFLCATIKRPRRQLMLVNGSPAYLGHAGALRLAGIGIDIKNSNDFEYLFVPVWTISEWIHNVLNEFNTKCKIEKGARRETCTDLRLPNANDMMSKIKNPEEHK